MSNSLLGDVMVEAKSYLMDRDYTPADSFSFGTVVTLLEEFARIKCVDLRVRISTLSVLKDLLEYEFEELKAEVEELKKCKEIKASVSVDESGMVELTIEDDIKGYCDNCITKNECSTLQILLNAYELKMSQSPSYHWGCTEFKSGVVG